jgi:protein O-GlcNAc transferase
LADAEQIYHRILATLPDHFDCLHLLGLIFLQRGHHARAVAQIEIALKSDPNNIFALNNRGIALKELKRRGADRIAGRSTTRIRFPLPAAQLAAGIRDAA